MLWTILEIALVLLAVCSQIAMVIYAYGKSGRRDCASVFNYIEVYSISDYIEASRDETGSIGHWFWIFIFSLIALLLVAANHFQAMPDTSPGLMKDVDLFSPIL